MKGKKPSPAAIQVTTDAGTSTTLRMGNHYAPLRPEDLELVLALASGKTCTQISQERGKYAEWANHRLQACMRKYAATTQMELLIKLIALGQIRAEAIWNE